METYAVFVIYYHPGTTDQGWMGPQLEVEAIDRKDACLKVLSKMTQPPPSIRTVNNLHDINNVKLFWCHKSLSQISDPENGFVSPKDL